MKTTTEPLTTKSRPESRMEVDEAPSSSGCFNLNVAQEDMNEGLDIWMPSEPVPSLRNLESGRIRPLMDVALPRLSSGSQIGAGTSSLKELQERLQARTSQSRAREAAPITCREYPVISSYSKIQMALVTDVTGTIGRWRNARGVMLSMISSLDYWGQSYPSPDENSGALVSGDLEFLWCGNASDVGINRDAGNGDIYSVILIKGTNDVSRGESKKR